MFFLEFSLSWRNLLDSDQGNREQQRDNNGVCLGLSSSSAMHGPCADERKRPPRHWDGAAGSRAHCDSYSNHRLKHRGRKKVVPGVGEKPDSCTENARLGLSLRWVPTAEELAASRDGGEADTSVGGSPAASLVWDTRRRTQTVAHRGCPQQQNASHGFGTWSSSA